MSIASYILSSALLSWIGIGIYFLYRWIQPAAKGRRVMVWLIVLASLTIPLFSSLGTITGTHGHTPEQLHEYEASLHGIIPPAGQTIHEFCSCTEPQARDVLLYQASRIYDTIIAHEAIISIILLICSMLLLLRQGLRIGRLYRLVRRYPVERMQIKGSWIYLVRGLEQVSAGSLRLGKAYIFWHPNLDALPKAEQDAILHHELSHIKQFNTYEKIILCFVQGFWFFNPALYFFQRELESLSEFQADTFATQSGLGKAEYARLLLKVKSNQGFAMLHFFKGSKLRNRVVHILKGSPRARIPAVPATIVGLLLLFSGDIVAQSLIDRSIQEIQVYEFMSKTHQETGQEEFCKKCTYEIVCE